MRAAVLYGREDVRVEQREPAPLQPGEVRVQVRAALTCGTDLKVFKRGYHAKMIVPPAVFGHELAGMVSESASPAWAAGERVVAANSAPCDHCFFCRHGQQNLCEDLLFLNGAYAESIVIPSRLVEKNLLRLKPETAFADAALTEPLACVVQGLRETGVKRDDRVLVLGAGPIGLMFTALLVANGCQVCVAGRGEARLAAAQKLGASQTVNVSQVSDSVAPIKEIGGRGFDVVIEAVGKPEAWEQAVQCVRKGGKVQFFGGCPAGTEVRLDTGLIHYSNLTLLASFHHTPAAIREALEHIESGAITARDFVTGKCALSDLPALLKSMAEGNRAVKTLVEVDR